MSNDDLFFAGLVFIVLLSIVLLPLLSLPSKPKIDKNLQSKLYDLLFKHVATVWDHTSFKDDKEYQRINFKKEVEKGELNYYEFKDYEKDNQIIKVQANFSGFNLTYLPENNSYTLSLHLGTSDDLRLNILKSLKEEFDNVQSSDGNYVRSFVFEDKS